MSNIKSEFTFTLTTPINYSEGGKFVDAFELTLKAPSNKNRNECAKLKQGFFRALKDLESMGKNKPDAKEEKAEPESDIDGDAILSIIMMADSVDYEKYQEAFRLLVTNGVCEISTTQKLNTDLYNNLSNADSERLMGDYLANFLLASQLQKMKGK